MKNYTVETPAYIIQYFDGITGLRYHYDHIGHDKTAALKDFLNRKHDCFASEGVTVMCLGEIVGGRESLFTEGAGSITKINYIACKGLNDVPARDLTTFCLRVMEGGTSNCHVYLRAKSN